MREFNELGIIEKNSKLHPMIHSRIRKTACISVETDYKRFVVAVQC